MAAPPAGEDAVSGAVPAPAEDPRQRRRRRRKVILLLFLAFLVGVLVLFTAWYLVTRKPISEVPLPVITQESLPHYVFSVYGVTRPMGIAVSPSGDRIYVTETEGERVVRVFDGKGNPVGTMGPPSTTGTEHVPVYLALDPQNGDVYVSDRPTGSIYVYSGDGVFRRTLRPRDPKLAGWQPLGLAFDAQGQLWVTDFSGPYNRVHAITRDGQVVRTIGEPGMFSFPNGVAVDASGNVYVTDSNHGRLMVFDPAGKQRSLIPQGSAAGDLGIPKGAAIDDSGRLYVVDTTAHQVQLYRVLGEGDRQPKYIGSFGVEGVGDGGFEFPFGVATDARSRVYVADWNNNRVQVWSY